MANVVKLPDDVAAKYELVNWVGSPRQIFGQLGLVDLNTITLKRAESLVNKGFKKLRVRSSTAAKQEEPATKASK